MRLDVKLERSLGWLKVHLPRIAWEKSMERLVNGGWQVEKWVYIYLLIANTDLVYFQKNSESSY